MTWTLVVRPGKAWVILLLCALTGLGFLAYAHSLTIGLIADDYLQIQLGRHYGPMTRWPALAADPLYRSRSTSIVMTHWTERWFGFSVLAFGLSSLLMHVLNTWLVFAAGAWRRIGWRASFVAAAFFAVYEGHQEAVMWYSALPELLVFFFSVSCLILWIRWIQQGGGRWYYAAALVCFVLALLSKESAVVVVPLLAIAVWMEARDWRRLLAVAPFAVLAALDVVAIFAGRSGNQHFGDGTFSLQAPFWIVWRNSFGRLLWFAGLSAAIAIAAWRQIRQRWPVVWPALVWIAITLLPYCFLTYMPRIPSRHTYFASAGLSLLVAAGYLTLEERCWLRRTWLPGVVASVVVLANCTYLWTRKHAQFVQRAEPTESLIRYVRNATGPVHVRCFPYHFSAAQLAVEIGAGMPASILVNDEDATQNGGRKRCGDSEVALATAPSR